MQTFPTTEKGKRQENIFYLAKNLNPIFMQPKKKGRKKYFTMALRSNESNASDFRRV